MVEYKFVWIMKFGVKLHFQKKFHYCVTVHNSVPDVR